MGSVDRSELMISFVESLRKTRKWYRKLFFHCLDVVLFNSYAVWNVISGTEEGISSFQLEVIRQILEKHGQPRSLVTNSSMKSNPGRLVGDHFPKHLPPTKKTNATKLCAFCNGKGKKRKETRYMCGNCDQALCIVPCFENFHKNS